jgi:hypothetical protein
MPRVPWYDDEDTDYGIETVPGDQRVRLTCSACGPVESQPSPVELLELVLAAEDHHREKHDGPSGA